MDENITTLMQLIAQRKKLELSLVEIDNEITNVQSMLSAKENMIDTIIAADNSLKNAEMRRLAKAKRLGEDEPHANLSERLNQLKQEKANAKIDIEECRSLYQVGLASLS